MPLALEGNMAEAPYLDPMFTRQQRLAGLCDTT